MKTTKDYTPEIQAKVPEYIKKYTDLNMKSDCLITIQTVYNPFAKMYEKSKD